MSEGTMILGTVVSLIFSWLGRGTEIRKAGNLFQELPYGVFFIWNSSGVSFVPLRRYKYYFVYHISLPEHCALLL
jgi:hypothetical protein